MVRFAIQAFLIVAIFGYALRSGGAPEKLVSSVYLVLLLVASGSFFVPDVWSSQLSQNGLYLRGSLDLLALIAIVIVGLRFDRWWVLWVASLQLICVWVYILELSGIAVDPVIFTIMERWPTWLAIFITGIATWRHSRQERLRNDAP